MRKLFLISVFPLLILTAGCGQTEQPQTKSPPPVSPPKQTVVQKGSSQEDEPQVEQRSVGIRGAIDRPVVQNELKQIGIYYSIYRTSNPRTQISLKDFVDTFRREAPHLAKKLEQEPAYYGIFPNAPQSSNAVLAYEIGGDTAGNHIVVMGDGSVPEQAMRRDELKALLKQEKK